MKSDGFKNVSGIEEVARALEAAVTTSVLVYRDGKGDEGKSAVAFSIVEGDVMEQLQTVAEKARNHLEVSSNYQLRFKLIGVFENPS